MKAATISIGSATGQAMQAEALAENKRLLYVGLTRARDMNVATSCVRPRGGPGRAWVEEIQGAADLLFGDSGTVALPDGRQLSRPSKSWSKDDCAVEPPAKAPENCHWFTSRPLVQGEPLWHRPSSASSGTFKVGETDAVGGRLSLAGKPDMASLGTALHLCIARASVLGGVSAAEVERILKNWAVAHSVDKDAVCAQVEAFQAWLATRWPGCRLKESLKPGLMKLIDELQAKLQSVDIPPADAKTIRELTPVLERTVRAIENQQVLNVHFQETEGKLLIQIPLILPGLAGKADIFVRDEDWRPGRGGRKESFRVVFALEMDALGDVMAQALFLERQ